MTTTHESVWAEASKTLKGILNPELFTRWFLPIRPLSIDDGALVLGVANEFYLIWLQDNFLPLIRDAVCRSSTEGLRVKLVVSEALQTSTAAATTGMAVVSDRPVVSNLKLNPRYTFESFVVGPNSHHGHAAALAVAQNPGRAYNPLFLYGGVGLGKTHLMQAIGHHASVCPKRAVVSYVTCEQFTNDFIQAIQDAALPKFRKRYRQCDVLLIDDVHFLAGKERLQEEFFHTFNALFDSHRQIVLSCDRPAAEVANLESRLVSRFEWGLVAELLIPDFETRLAIVRNRAASMKVRIPDDILAYLAANIRANIRRLEGALTRVACHASLSSKHLSVEAVALILRDLLHEESKLRLTISAIQEQVAEHFDLRQADMTSRRRPASVAFPRQIAMYLSRTLTDHSLTDIGDHFGGRDHGTVLHACRLVEERAKKEVALQQKLSYMEQQLRRGQTLNNR